MRDRSAEDRFPWSPGMTASIPSPPVEISRVAVANRGEAANALPPNGAELVGLSSHAAGNGGLVHLRRRGAPPFTRLATRAACLGEPITLGPDGQPCSTYLDIDRIIAAAKSMGADALWPGWGFASERPELAEACADAGLAFLGPPASAMRALGDKIAAKRLAESCDVPVSPWSGGPVD